MPPDSPKGILELLEGPVEVVVLDCADEWDRDRAIEVLEAQGLRPGVPGIVSTQRYCKVNGTRLIWWERRES